MSDQSADGMNREWIEGLLSDPEFVEWDRYTRGIDNGEQRIDVYGWIERSGDEYKDFVVLTLWPDAEDLAFTTSSARFSDVLQLIWAGEDSLDDHDHCQRVEDTFDITNATTLDDRPTDPSASQEGQR